MNSGLCANGGTSSESAAAKLSSTPPVQTLSVQLADGASTTDATSSHDCSDEEEGGIWRTQSAEVASRIHKNSTESWTVAVEQAPVDPSTTLAKPAEYHEHAPKSQPEHAPPSAAVTEPEPAQKSTHHEPAHTEPHHEPAHAEPHQPTPSVTEPTTGPTTNEEEERAHASGSPSNSQNFPLEHEKEGAAAEQRTSDM